MENLTSVYLSVGKVLEEVNFFRQEAFKENPDYRFCSAGTIARDLKKLSVENTGFQAVESGKTYQFNINDMLNDLLLNGLIQLGMLDKEQPVTFDYDNQRGSSERTFDMQNNDFGWKPLPFSSPLTWVGKLVRSRRQNALSEAKGRVCGN